MSPWLSHLSRWVQLLLKIFHWDKPAIVISRWNESLVVPSFPLRDKGLAEYVFEMRISIKPETPTFILTCNFLLKYKIHSLLIFHIEMSPWLSLLSRWERQRSCRVHIQNEDVHIARNSYFWFNAPKIVISHWNEPLVTPSFPLSSASCDIFPLR